MRVITDPIPFPNVAMSEIPQPEIRTASFINVSDLPDLPDHTHIADYLHNLMLYGYSSFTLVSVHMLLGAYVELKNDEDCHHSELMLDTIDLAMVTLERLPENTYINMEN